MWEEWKYPRDVLVLSTGGDAGGGDLCSGALIL